MHMNSSVTKLMPFTKSRLLRWGRLTAFGLLALGAAACGVSATSGRSATSKVSSASAVGGSGISSATQRPLTIGTVTSVNGSTITVQTTQFGPVSVIIDSATIIHEIEKVPSSSMTVGDCVVATGKRVASGTFAATTVAISKATSTGCTQGISKQANSSSVSPYPGGAGVHYPGEAGVHSLSSSTSLSKAQREAIAKRFSSIEVAAGQVISVNGNTVTLHLPKRSSSSPSLPSPSSTKKAIPRPHFTIASSFTFGPQTTFTETLPATIGAIASGDCVTAFGPANTSGIVTAKTITVSTPGPSGCSSGLGHFPGFPVS